ncbi:MAG: hypothetical protein LBR56_03285, partial [Sporomusaceae bacterium]|nr:hypothetical protein [Sporomusaceae bacterium]
KTSSKDKFFKAKQVYLPRKVILKKTALIVKIYTLIIKYEPSLKSSIFCVFLYLKLTDSYCPVKMRL